MKKKGSTSLLTVAVSCWLSVTGTVNAEDKILKLPTPIILAKGVQNPDRGAVARINNV